MKHEKNVKKVVLESSVRNFSEFRKFLKMFKNHPKLSLRKFVNPINMYQAYFENK